MHTKKFFACFFVFCMLSMDFMIPAVLAGGYHKGHHGIELLLAAGILAKLLRKKGHHHHHHGHHHHGHHHHGHHGSGSRNVEVVHVAPPGGGYSPYYPTTAQSSYGGAQAATTSFSSSVEYPFNPQASHAMSQHMPYGGPSSAASYLGYEPQPIQYQSQPMPYSMPMTEAAGPMYP